MTNPLYQIIMQGKATKRLLQNFIIHRFPIKNLWTRNILGIASRIDDYNLRCELVENIYEEETGKLSNSKRHLQTFINFGECLSLTKNDIETTSLLTETKAVMEHNLEVCNSSSIHFTAGVASVLLLMEGQPPIVNSQKSSMENVMREIYKLPFKGYEFFTHHASNPEGAVSDLEDDHANTARAILLKYCDTQTLKQQAITFLERAVTLRHKHFDAILAFYNTEEEPFRYKEENTYAKAS